MGRCRILDALIFIDTNIYLDFYRAWDKSFELKMLKHIDKNHNKIISTDQVLMEYKKNRQKVIIDSLNAINKQAWKNLIFPSFMSSTQQTKAIKTKKKQIDSQIKKLNRRVINLLKHPITKDSIYQCLQRILKDDALYYLGRNNKLRYSLRHLAKKRFCLGYPLKKE